MRLFFRETGPSKEMVQDLAEARIGKNKKAGEIAGFAGAFGFSLPPVYLSDYIQTVLDKDPAFEEELEDFIKRLYRDDYGDVSDKQDEDNKETRWFCGCAAGIVARYYSGIHGAVWFKCFRGFCIFYSPVEKPDKLLEKYSAED